MNAEEQRIAIAEACGWKHIQTAHSSLIGVNKEPEVFRPIPDYLHDLNACHEFEETFIEGHQWIGYLQNLGVVSGVYGEISKAVHATAAQRAEAFLKTIGKWKD